LTKKSIGFEKTLWGWLLWVSGTLYSKHRSRIVPDRSSSTRIWAMHCRWIALWC